MPIQRQKQLKRFIVQNNLTQASFNKYDSGGAHTEYVVAAARQRGLKVLKVGPDCYFYEKRQVIGGMRSMLSSLVSSLAVSISASNTTTKSFFQSADVPVPVGHAFSADNFECAADYFLNFAKPVVLKPTEGSAGKGVTSGVTSLEQFRRAWERG